MVENRIVEDDLSDAEERLLEKKIQVALRVVALLRDKKWKRKQLAEAMGISEQSLSRMLGTVGSNLTLSTICNMEAALKEDLLMTPQQFEYQLINDFERASKLRDVAIQRRNLAFPESNRFIDYSTLISYEQGANA